MAARKLYEDQRRGSHPVEMLEGYPDCSRANPWGEPQVLNRNHWIKQHFWEPDWQPAAKLMCAPKCVDLYRDGRQWQPIPMGQRVFTSVIQVPLRTDRPDRHQKQVSGFASYWLRHAGVNYPDASVEWPAFALAVCFAHRYMWTYTELLEALALANILKCRWKLCYAKEGDLFPAYIQCVQGGCTTDPAQIPGRVLFTPKIIGLN